MYTTKILHINGQLKTYTLTKSKFKNKHGKLELYIDDLAIVGTRFTKFTVNVFKLNLRLFSRSMPLT